MSKTHNIWTEEKVKPNGSLNWTRHNFHNEHGSATIDPRYAGLHDRKTAKDAGLYHGFDLVMSYTDMANYAPTQREFDELDSAKEYAEMRLSGKESECVELSREYKRIRGN